MKKLFFSTLIAVVAGSAAFASVGTPLANEVYYRPTITCTVVAQCSTIPNGVPCGVAQNNVYYLPGCSTITTAYYRL